MPAALSEEKRGEILALYEQGTKPRDIAVQMGIARSTVYSTLRRAAARIGSRPMGEDSLETVLSRLAEAERTIGRLQAELERERAVSAVLAEQLQRTGH